MYHCRGGGGGGAVYVVTTNAPSKLHQRRWVDIKLVGVAIVRISFRSTCGQKYGPGHSSPGHDTATPASQTAYRSAWTSALHMGGHQGRKSS